MCAPSPSQGPEARPVSQAVALGDTCTAGQGHTRSLCRSWPNTDMSDGPSTAWAEAHFLAGLGSNQGRQEGPCPGRQALGCTSPVEGHQLLPLFPQPRCFLA